MSDPEPSRRLDGSEALRDELVRELLEGRLIGVFATLDRAGGVHAAPMWYASAEDCVLLATGSRSRKVRNVEADPRATLVIHDSRPGFEVCGVSMAGLVEVVRGSEAERLIERVHGRYVAPGAESDPTISGFLASDDVALRFHPQSALTWDERFGRASEALRASGHALPLLPTEPRP